MAGKKKEGGELASKPKPKWLGEKKTSKFYELPKSGGEKIIREHFCK